MLKLKASFLFLIMFFSLVVDACYFITIVFMICHINVHFFNLFIVTHIGGCGVLLIVAPHHCQATPSPSSSSYSFGHYHYEFFLLLQPTITLMILSSCACNCHGHHGLLIVAINSYMPLSSSSYDIDHCHSFLINVTSNYTPLPFLS